MGMVYPAQGKRAESLQIIKQLEEMSEASLCEVYWIARIYAALNEKEMASRFTTLRGIRGAFTNAGLNEYAC